jgi:flagellar protein FlaJ
VLALVPLLLAALLAGLVVAGLATRRVGAPFTRLALAAFGEHVRTTTARHHRQRERLHAAHVATTHRVYAARTLLSAALLGVAGSVAGVYALVAAVALLRLGPTAVTTPPALSPLVDAAAAFPDAGLPGLFLLLLASSATVGALAAGGTYWLRWRWQSRRVAARAAAIEATLPRAVAFVYALSRSGMAVPAVLATLADNDHVYGEAAREVGVAVREMDAFGTDVLTALQRLARRTPSDGLAEFGENLASVLGSGRSLSSFLRDQYDRYQREAVAQQEQYLDLVATLAEVYVTVLVAGPLFFITVLVVVGLVIADTVPVLAFVAYVGLPLATAGFSVYLDSLTQNDWEPEQSRQASRSGSQAGSGSNAALASATADARTDGGVAADRANWDRLAAYDRLRPVRRVLADPFGTLRERPAATLPLTLSLGLLWVALHVAVTGVDLSALAAFDLASVPDVEFAAVADADLVAAVGVVDGPVVEATLVVFAVFAVLYEARKRERRRLAAAVPDLLDRLASVNEAGATAVESLRRVSRSDLGALTPELARLRRDLDWGADAETALRRFERRVGAPSVSRAVTLITNSLRASGDISPVLRIAADEAQSARRLQAARRQELVTYILVVYVAFLVFLGILAALTVSFIPAVEGATAGSETAGSAASAGFLAGLGRVDPATYELLFFHTAAVQAVCSGLLAGQLAEGRLADGVKHATLLLALAYLTFALL